MAAPAAAKPPPRNRKTFVRTEVPRKERAASIATVVLIAVIGAIIWYKGRHYDPRRFAAHIESLKSTAAAVEGKAGTVRTADARLEGGMASAQARPAGGEAGSENLGGYSEGAAPAPAVKGEPLEIKLAGLQPMSDTEFYGPDNLFEKIDGRAPAYLNFNFQQLRSRSFTITGTAGSFVDVYEYRFDTPVNAFGMFSMERDPKGKPLDFAPDGYAGEMGFFFRQGATYVQIIASDQNAKTMALAKSIADIRAKLLPADDAGLAARRRLPATGLDATTVSFVQENAQGQEFLKNVFQASYDFGGKKLPFFIMVAAPAEAAAAWQSYLDFSGKFGGKASALPDVNGAKIFQAESFGAFKVIFQKDGEIGGVYDADDRDKALQFVEQYLQGKIP
jgi:hypothetical protein